MFFLQQLLQLWCFCLVLIVCVGSQIPCPEDADIFPCTCTADASFRFDVDCSDIQDENELNKVFKVHFPFDAIRRFVIRKKPDEPRVPIRKLGPTVFKSKTFEEVIISHTELMEVDTQTFLMSNETLTSLQLPDNKLESFQFELLKSFTKLEILYLHSNMIYDVSDLMSNTLVELDLSYNDGLYFGLDAFHHVPNLKDLLLQDIGLTYVQPNLFNSLVSLEVLDLSHNLMERMETDALKFNSTTVKELKLNHNKLASSGIDRGHIDGLATPSYLFLQNNELTVLDELVWRPVFEQVQGDAGHDLFVFDHNDIDCGCSLAWLVQSDTFKDILAYGAICDTGDVVHDLDPNYYVVNC